MKRLKRLLFVVILFMGIVNLVYCQHTSDCPISDVKKGRIMNDDGIQIKFKHLNCRNDTVYFTNVNGVPQKMAIANIVKVERTKNQVALYSISFGLGALIGSAVGTMSWNGTDLEDKKAGFIVGSTIGFAVLGGVVGLFVKKHNEVYRNPEYSFDFKIAPLACKPNEKYYTVGLRIRF